MYPFVLKKSQKQVFSKVKKHYGTYWDMRDALSRTPMSPSEPDPFISFAARTDADPTTENRYNMSRVYECLVMWVSGDFKDAETMIFYKPRNLMNELVRFCNKIESIVDIEFENNVENIQDYI